MSKGSRKEQICLAASDNSAVGRGAQANLSAETALPGAAEFGDVSGLWVSGSCRAPACPATSCQGLEWARVLQGRQGRCWGSPFSKLVPAVGRARPCLEGKGGGLAPPAPVLALRSQAESSHAGCPPSPSHTVHLVCRLQGAKKLCPQCNTITSPGDLRRIYL